jgi:hypothetical protein
MWCVQSTHPFPAFAGFVDLGPESRGHWNCVADFVAGAGAKTLSAVQGTPAIVAVAYRHSAIVPHCNRSSQVGNSAIKRPS